MFRKMNLVVALLATLLVIATNASSQTNGCNCANASLVGDTVGTRFNLGPGPINRVVGSGIELPGAGPILGAAGSSPRWNIDVGSNTIRIDFLQQPATYGMGSYFTFSSLDPLVAGCPPAFISGITVTTNKPSSQFNVVGAATFGPHTVKIQIAPNGGNLDWQPGEFILVKLKFACDTSSQGNDCPGNLVPNGNFTSGLAPWSAAYGTPDFSPSMGAQDLGVVGMWGNMNPAIGEGLKQTLSLVQGKTYAGSIWFKRVADPNKQPYAKFRLRATTTTQSLWGLPGTIYVSPDVYSTVWAQYNFTFTAPANATILTINVENNLSANDGRKTSYGQVDNICIREVPSLPCCECLGKVTTLDLSTGQGGPIDPLWNVNAGPAYTTPPFPGWTNSLTPARWIQPVASPTPSSNVPPGVYNYTVEFNIPKCTIPSDVRLDVRWAADNSGKVFLDNNTAPVASCALNTCFQTGVALPFSLTALGPGTHRLRFEVRNNEGPSGLIVNAKLTRKCAGGNPGSQGDLTMEPN